MILLPNRVDRPFALQRCDFCLSTSLSIKRYVSPPCAFLPIGWLFSRACALTVLSPVQGCGSSTPQDTTVQASDPKPTVHQQAFADTAQSQQTQTQQAQAQQNGKASSAHANAAAAVTLNAQAAQQAQDAPRADEKQLKPAKQQSPRRPEPATSASTAPTVGSDNQAATSQSAAASSQPAPQPQQQSQASAQSQSQQHSDAQATSQAHASAGASPAATTDSAPAPAATTAPTPVKETKEITPSLASLVSATSNAAAANSAPGPRHFVALLGASQHGKSVLYHRLLRANEHVGAIASPPEGATSSAHVAAFSFGSGGDRHVLADLPGSGECSEEMLAGASAATAGVLVVSAASGEFENSIARSGPIFDQVNS